MNETVAVTTYQLSAENMNISFSTSDSGEPELLYDNGEGELKFSGREINQENTSPGLMITVTLQTIPDLGTETLSVMLPAGKRPENMRSIPLATFALITTNKTTTIAGPQMVEGQIQDYKLFELEGNGW